MFRRSYHKLIRAFALAISISLVLALVAQAATLGQIFGALDTGGRAGGSDAYLTTPDPPLGYNQGSVGLTATTNYYSNPFIEAGAEKHCDVGCWYHPYSNANDINGLPHDMVDWNDGLLAGGWYRYKDYFIGNNKWESQFCSGAGCKVLQDADLRSSNAMRYALSGGESSSTSTGISTSTSNNQWWSSSWSLYCYNKVLINTGGISGCGGNHDWSVHNP